MQAQLEAMRAAVYSVAAKRFITRSRTLTGLATAALMLGACMPATIPLAGPDPSDPGAKVAGVGYRSTVAPYTSLRPTTPSAWREQNDRVAPAPKSGQ